MHKLISSQLMFAAVLLLLTGIADARQDNQAATEKSAPAKRVETHQESNQHETSDGHKKYPANALAKETSPYLLMHAHNPVRWYAWNEATLAKAKLEDKPIFLSIGYSSCHWCHVMERESFLDEEIANFLNEHFICIKVDREERPDVDEIYMESLHVWNQVTGKGGGGGWPLSMFLLPDGRPFFGGTYFPARTGDRAGGVGFLTVIQKINEFATQHRPKIEQDAAVITRLTRKSLAGREPIAGMALQRDWIVSAQNGLRDDFDTQFGGFRFSLQNPNVPKFPEPSNLLFLADQLRTNPQDADAKRMLVTTCQRMMMGGIYDHLGGGFHRYSVDRYWRIPHYEKMLYDNGQLATVYAEAYALTGREEFKNVVLGILRFVDRELISKQGGFYASLDAESEGVEGKFYVWDKSEIQTALTQPEFGLFASVYGIDGAPNFEGKHYAPQLSQPMAEHAKRLNITTEELESQLEPIRQKLLEVRSQRVRPALDNKILTSWNGMMIRGYADAGRVLKNEAYIATGIRAAEFGLKHLADQEGRLFRTHTGGETKLNAYLIDYACWIDGLLALHRATGEAKWLKLAEKFQQKQDELFWDDQGGGYFYTSSDHEVLLARSKKPTDGAVPAGNSVAAGNLIYLAEHWAQGDPSKSEGANASADYRERARQTALSSAPLIQQLPIAAPRMLITIQELLKSK